jgi:hypothetical protein
MPQVDERGTRARPDTSKPDAAKPNSKIEILGAPTDEPAVKTVYPLEVLPGDT